MRELCDARDHCWIKGDDHRCNRNVFQPSDHSLDRPLIDNRLDDIHGALCAAAFGVETDYLTGAREVRQDRFNGVIKTGPSGHFDLISAPTVR